MFFLGVISLAVLVVLGATGAVAPRDPVTIAWALVTGWLLFAPIRARAFRKQ